MIDEEGSESRSGNPDESKSPEGEDAKAESYVMGDARFKSTEDLYKSYKSLESKLGNVRELEQKAKAWEDASEALAAERDIPASEAAQLLREESSKLREKHAPKLEATKQSDELRSMRLELEKRDLLDDVPEAREIMPQVLEYARATGKSARESFERFRPLVDKMTANKQSMPTAPKSSNRSADEDFVDRSEYDRKMEDLRNTRDPIQRSALLSDALKSKLFSGRQR